MRKNVRKAISEMFGPNKGDQKWFSHGHLHHGNILVRVAKADRINDIKIIDFKYVESHNLSYMPELEGFIKDRGKELRGANLYNARLEGIVLPGVDLRKAHLGRTILT